MSPPTGRQAMPNKECAISKESAAIGGTCCPKAFCQGEYQTHQLLGNWTFLVGYWTLSSTSPNLLPPRLVLSPSATAEREPCLGILLVVCLVTTPSTARILPPNLFSINFQTYLEISPRCFYLCSRLGKRAFKIKFCLPSSERLKLKFKVFTR